MHKAKGQESQITRVIHPMNTPNEFRVPPRALKYARWIRFYLSFHLNWVLAHLFMVGFRDCKQVKTHSGMA